MPLMLLMASFKNSHTHRNALHLTTIPHSEQACLGIISMVRSMAIGSGYHLGQWARASIIMTYILKSAEFFPVFCNFLNEERSKNYGTGIFWEPQKMRTRWYIISFLGYYIIFILSA
jgi:hypothetical protein